MLKQQNEAPKRVITTTSLSRLHHNKIKAGPLILSDVLDPAHLHDVSYTCRRIRGCVSKMAIDSVVKAP